MIPPFSQNSIELTVLPQPHTVHKNKRNIRIQTKPVTVLSRCKATVLYMSGFPDMCSQKPDIYSMICITLNTLLP